MKLSENQELVQKLKQILDDYPGVEYAERRSARLDDALIVKVSPDVKCGINSADNIAKKLSESTEDTYKVQSTGDSDGSTLDALRSFKLSLSKPHRNVRITYPDSKDGTLEVDVIQSVGGSINLEDPQLWHFAEGNKLEIRLNTFANPNYRKFLRTDVVPLVRNSNESSGDNYSSNSELEKIIDDNTDSRD